MDKRLKGIQAKFDVVQEFGPKIVMNLMGSMNGRIKLGEPFEVFYDSVCMYPTLDFINQELSERRVDPITEEDLRYLYECTRKNLKR